MTKLILKNWEKETQKLTDYFLKSYFNDPEWYWVSNLIGETLCVDDYFFNLDMIIEAIRYNAPAKKLFDFYELELEFAHKGKPMEINFYHYLKCPKLCKTS